MNVSFQHENSSVCSFTGYRPSKLPFEWDRNGPGYRRLYAVLHREISALAERGVRFFQTGMARGVDLMCGEIVIGLKKTHNVRLICAIPCLNQCAGWNREDAALYQRLLERSDGVVQVTSEPYRDGCMLRRNRYLVDTAQYLIAVFDGQRGGTMSTVNYAKKQGRTIIIINPADYTRVELIHGNEEGVLYV